MGTSVIPFESAQLPAFLSTQAEVNDDLTAHAGTGFPVISIKGKTFAIVRGGERSIIPNPKDPDSPATNIEVIIVKASKATSKIYYAKGYKEGEEGVKPDCWSADGTKPDASIEVPQAKTCAACKHNVWGSRIGDSGQKSKACQDSVRIAVAAPNQINDPMLLRVPPASIRSLGELGDTLKKRGVRYDAVITKVSFDPEAATPKLVFKPIGFISEPMWHEVQAAAESPVVQQILGAMPISVPSEPAAPAVEMSKDKKVTEAEVEAAISKAAGKPAKAKAEPKPEPVAAGDIDVEGLDLSKLNFDD